MRCCVVANGREFYERALADPAAMPKDMEFEALLSIGDEAWEQAGDGGEFPPQTSVSYETFANAAGWPDAT